MGLTVYGGGGKPEEEKTVTAGTSAIVVNPSSGKVMKKVTVNPTPTESKSVTPTTSELTVTPSSGKHLSQVVVGAVEDVTPEVTAQTPVITQIAENLGVTITTPSGTNKQILQGNNTNLQTINTNFTGTQEKTVTPTTAGLEVTPDEGYLLNKVVVSGDSDLVADNIRKDIDIFGVVGTLVEGATVKKGTVTLSNSTSANIAHGLGAIPTVFGLNNVVIKCKNSSPKPGAVSNFTVGVTANATKLVVNLSNNDALSSHDAAITSLSWYAGV